MRNKIYNLLKFKLGEEYEPYEFQLIPIPPYEFLENNLSLEPYEYFGEIKEIFGLRVKQSILYFNCDILMKVELRFKGDVTNVIKTELEILDKPLLTIMFLKMYHEAETGDTVFIYQKKSLGPIK